MSRHDARSSALPLPFGADQWDNETPDKGRADGCANTNIGPGRSTEEIDVGTSLPPAAIPAQPTPDTTYAERMARIDGCPECVVNTETPHTIESTLSGFTAFYLCADCGHSWFTAWGDR